MELDWKDWNARRGHADEISNTRRGFLGGSDAAMVYKIGRKGIGALCATDKKRIGVLLGFSEAQQFGGNKWTEAGHDFEDVFERVAATWKEGYAREKRLDGNQYKHFGVLAHADFVRDDSTVYELKCVHGKSTEKVIVTYYAQLQWYYMLGAKDVFLVHAETPEGSYNQRYIERNDGVIAALKEGLMALDTYCAEASDKDVTTQQQEAYLLPMDVEAAATLWLVKQRTIASLLKEAQRYENIVLGYMQRERIDEIDNGDGTKIVLEKAYRQIDESVLLQRYPQTLKDGDIYTTTQTKLKLTKQQ